MIHQDNASHFLGVGIFCVGSFSYSFAFVRLARTGQDRNELLHATMEMFLLLAVVALVIAFVTLWIEEENAGKHAGAPGPQNAYIVEHTAYIVHLLFYTFFFLYHSPDRRKEAGRYVIGGEYYHDDSFSPSEPPLERCSGVPMVCRPLLVITSSDPLAIQLS